jgi:hypothetical protein
MITAVRIPLILILISTSALTASRPHQKAEESAAYLGFDRNDYPGDGKLQVLRRTFSYSGYWLNAPPGEKTTSWTGKRNRLLRAGFLVLFNGKTDAQIRAGGDPKELGKSDAKAASNAARKEGFRPGTIIFVDEEEGGRLLPERKDYLYAWIDDRCQRISRRRVLFRHSVPRGIRQPSRDGRRPSQPCSRTADLVLGQQRRLPAFAWMRISQASSGS